jgi:hypothetical protein
MHAVTHARSPLRRRERGPRRVQGITDNVIREKGEARTAPRYHLAEVSLTRLMDSAERVITVERRHRRNRAFFSGLSFHGGAGSRSGLGAGRFIHPCEKYACTVGVAWLALFGAVYS